MVGLAFSRTHLGARASKTFEKERGDCGAVVHERCPRQADDNRGPAVTDQVANHGRPDFGDLRVLVVDDDPTTLDIAVAALNSLGITHTATAMEGAQALTMITPEVDVILCDLNMPGMDGLSVIGELAQSPFAGGLILISGESPALLRTAAELARVHGLELLGTAGKPLTAENLTTLLARHARRPGGAARDLRAPLGRQLAVDELAGALDAGHLSIHYQPQVRTSDGRLCGVEALARLHAPEGGIVPPDAFIGVAEDSGLIEQLTREVVATVTRDAPALIARAGDDITISVNVSAENLYGLTLPDDLEALVRAQDLVPSQFILEVTESRLIEDLARSLEVLSRLRLKGFGLSIDDFGTGFAGMKQLRVVPFSELKIDRVFVQAAGDDDAARAIIEASIDLARKLDLSVVAEGVETKAEWDLMRQLGVDVVQGFLVAKPMPLAECLTWLMTWVPANLDEAPVLDTEPLRRIIGDDPVREAGFVRAFVSQAQAGGEELAAAILVGDATALTHLGHRLKSTARGVGAMALGEVSEAVEQAGRSGDLAEAAVLLPRFEQQLTALRAAADRRFGTVPEAVQGPPSPRI